MSELKKTFHTADVCVLGGGLAGTFAAIAAARHGAHVVLMQDRPVLGGNASSEIRMWVSGAGTRVRNLQETGIMEEFLLENMHLNPDRNFSVWDSIFYGKVKAEKNIELMLNCACCAAECRDGRIESVTGFQLTTYTWRTVKAKIFIDCSGDSILAELADAEYMVGREAKSQFGEAFGLPEADRKTMGMSLMIQAHETDHPCPFTAPDWAYRYNTDEEMKFKPHECLDKINTNFYWIELGGEADSIHDTETTRDELLKIAFGVWDHMKNRGNHGAENWELDFIGFLPGKRVSGRCNKTHRLRHIRRKHQIGLQQGLVQRIGQIDLICAQHLQHPVGSGGAQHQLHLRAQGVVAFEQTRQEGGAHRIRQRDAQTAADLPGGLQGSLRLLRRGQQGACIA